MNWQSMTIRHKLFSGFGLILLVTVLFGALLLSGLFSNELQEILSFYKKDSEEVSNLPQVNQWEWAELLADDEKNTQPEEIREPLLN